MPVDPDVFLVIWNGEMMELEAPDAIVFTEADAAAYIAASPGRRASYSFDRRSVATLLSGERFASIGDRLRSQLTDGDKTPIVLRDESERSRRQRSTPDD